MNRRRPLTVITACGRNEPREFQVAITNSVVALSGMGRPVRWIVVLDGSAKPWDAPAEFLPSLDGRQVGCAITRNRGLAIAKPGWVLSLDADDVLLPQTEDLICHVEDLGLSWGAALAADIGPDDKYLADPINVLGNSRILRRGEAWDAAKRSGIFPWRCSGSMVMDRDLMASVGGFHEAPELIRSADIAMTAAVTAEERGAWWARVTSLYRKHPGQLTAVPRSANDDWVLVDQFLAERAGSSGR